MEHDCNISPPSPTLNPRESISLCRPWQACAACQRLPNPVITECDIISHIQGLDKERHPASLIAQYVRTIPSETCKIPTKSLWSTQHTSWSCHELLEMLIIKFLTEVDILWSSWRLARAAGTLTEASPCINFAWTKSANLDFHKQNYHDVHTVDTLLIQFLECCTILS